MIKKRNSTLVPFDETRISRAIDKAMMETKEGVNKALTNMITKNIKMYYEEQFKKNNEYTLCVEQIQDFVEEQLMNSHNKDAARKYILYRENRASVRATKSPLTKAKLIDDEFLSKYKHLPTPMTALGEFVYYRTYSRWLPQEKRREYWWETCARTVEHNCSLVETSAQEAQELYDNMFFLKQFLSGRAMWISGTDSVKKHPSSLFNCSHIVVDNFNAYKDICYLLMLGCGVGFNVQKQFVNNLPKVKANVQLTHKNYNAVQKSNRKEVTEFTISKDVIEIIVGDSKIGWSQAIDYLIKTFYQIDFSDIKFILFNYDNVRPFGEELKTFGGKASGHDALKSILDKTYKVLTKDNVKGKKLKPIDCMDIANIIAEGIVVGGVRRSAEMCLFDADDEEIKNAKTNLYIKNEMGVWSSNDEIIHRMMSNNSVAFYKKPSFKELQKRFETIRHSSEGNFFNMEHAIKRKPTALGTNPCGKFCLM